MLRRRDLHRPAYSSILIRFPSAKCGLAGTFTWLGTKHLERAIASTMKHDPPKRCSAQTNHAICLLVGSFNSHDRSNAQDFILPQLLVSSFPIIHIIPLDSPSRDPSSIPKQMYSGHKVSLSSPMPQPQPPNPPKHTKTE